MVVYSGLLCACFDALLGQVDQIWWAQFTEASKGFCPGVDREANVLVLDDPTTLCQRSFHRASRRRTYSGMAGTTILWPIVLLVVAGYY